MRHYSIKAIHGTTTFTCPICKYSVTLLEFDSQNGNRRTQAARALNAHAAAEHPRPFPRLEHNSHLSPAR